MTRKIAVVTGTRAEFGLFRWIAEEIHAAADFELCLIVTGAHLSPEYGYTVREIEASNLPIAERVEILLSSDSGVGVAKAMGLGLIGFSDALARQAPDLLLLLGDRFETIAAGATAVCMGVPVAHLCGGEVTEGAVDEQWRHALTKLSHVHLVATEPFGRRVLQMGEEDWRVHVVGSPGLETFRRTATATEAELADALGFTIGHPLVLVTYHPTTHQLDEQEQQMDSFLSALAAVDAQMVITYPNADAGGRYVLQRLQQFAAGRPRVHLVQSLGSFRYVNLMRVADAVVGNSSSGIIEAPAVPVPVVNVGDRQKGRLRAANVIDVPCAAAAIVAALQSALDPRFRRSLVGLVNPYGDGRTSERVLEALRRVPWGRTLIEKRFADRPV